MSEPESLPQLVTYHGSTIDIEGLRAYIRGLDSKRRLAKEFLVAAEKAAGLRKTRQYRKKPKEQTP